MVIEYIKFFHTDNALVGENGQCISETNPPAYLAGAVKEVKKIGVHFCCQTMEDQMNAGRVTFGSRPEETHYNTFIDVFIRVENGAQRLEPWHLAVNGGTEQPRPAKPNTDLVIAYCPWCAAPVWCAHGKSTS